MDNLTLLASIPVATDTVWFRTQKQSGLCRFSRASARVTSFQQPKEVTKKGHPYMPSSGQNIAQAPFQARGRSAVKWWEFRKDAKLGPAAPRARLARLRFDCASGEERACRASFFSPLFLDEQKMGLARMQERNYESATAFTCETLTSLDLQSSSKVLG